MNKIRLIILITLCFLVFNQASFAQSLKDGLGYYKSGNYQKAEGIFRQALFSNPSDYTARYMLAVTLVNLQNYSEAKELYKNVIKNSGNQKLASISRSGLINLGEEFSATKAILNVNIAGNVMIVNNVILNDMLKTSFVFDTGASYTTISKEIARQLNISAKNAQKIKIMTASGYINAPLVKIPKIEINGVSVKNVETIITDLPIHSAGNSNNLAGLLGLSFLEHFKLTVDRANRQIILEKN